MATKRAYVPVRKVDFDKRRKDIFEMLERANCPPQPDCKDNHDNQKSRPE